MGRSLGIKTIKFEPRTFRTLVIQEIYGYRLRDGRPVTKISNDLFEYKPEVENNEQNGATEKDASDSDKSQKA